MAYLPSKFRGLTLMLVAGASLLAAVTADAAVYRGKWDPAYGADLPNLGWEGFADFEIKDNCLSGIDGDGWVSNTDGDCKGLLSIVSAEVTLYALDDSASDVTLSYSSAKVLAGGNLPKVDRMWVDYIGPGQQAQVKAVDGWFWLPETTNASFAVASSKPYVGAAYWLGFNGFAPNGEAEARLGSCSYMILAFDCSLNNNDPRNGGAPAAMTITPVPEPQAYALGLASLAVVGVWTRRRRRSA